MTSVLTTAQALERRGQNGLHGLEHDLEAQLCFLGDGMIGKEAKTLLRKLSRLLADKWEKPIAIVRATHQCIRGSRVPTAHMSKRLPLWEDKAGLSLFRL